jgi:hypothetical protein
MTLSPVELRRLARRQSEAKADAHTAVVPRLAEANVGGVTTLAAVFPATSTAPDDSISLSFLLDFPHLRKPLSYTLLRHLSARPSPATRRRIASEIRDGIVKFLLDEGQTDITMPELTNVASRFVWWLNRADLRFSDARKAGLLRTAGSVLATASRHTDQTGIGEPSEDWPRNPWKGRAITKPAQERFLEPAAMSRLLKMCRADAEERMAATIPLLDAFDAGERKNRVVSAALDAAAQMKTALSLDRNANPNPPIEALGSSLQRPVRQLIAPGVPEIMPFLILLLHYTRFNQQTLLDLTLDGVRRVRFLGVERIIITGIKTRPAPKPQTVAFSIDDSSTNPSVLLAFLERWLGTMRLAIGSRLLFVAKGDRRVVELGPQARVRSVHVAQSLRAYLNGRLDPFNLPSVRKGMIDVAHLLSGGDPEIASATGNHSTQVSEDHYSSPAGGRRDAVRLALAMSENERWLASGGQVDARRLPEKEDRSAATPGFVCLSNRTSPVPGQIYGRLCSAYGRCPTCPLASVDRTSARSCAYLHLLLHRIETSFDTDDVMNAGAFIGLWGPIAKELRDSWLPAFTRSARERAKTLDLPDLPELT